MNKNSAPVCYFLGANTSEGFTSYYHEFLRPEDGDFLWYIKGGPGNGKSTLMRTVARAAEDQGKQVEYAFCSGDPDSLDGIYIREDKLGYVDATSPHVQEPGLPGAGGRYLDLSGCYLPGVEQHRAKIRELFRAYREQYSRCYDLLRAAALVSPDKIPGVIGQEEIKAAKRRAAELTEQYIKEESTYHAEHRFLSAYTCRGYLSFWDQLDSQTIVPIRAAGSADEVFQEMHRKCRELGCHVILCPDPLRPERLEGLILPEQSLVFTSAPSEADLCEDEEYKRSQALQSALLLQAEESLKNARRFHDQLEEHYHPFVDFSAVDDIIRAQLQRL